MRQVPDIIRRSNGALEDVSTPPERKPTPYEQGRDAGLAGTESNTNPIDCFDFAGRREWLNGWRSGRAKLRIARRNAPAAGGETKAREGETK